MIRQVSSGRELSEPILVPGVVELEEHILVLILIGDDGLLSSLEIEKLDAVAV